MRFFHLLIVAMIAIFALYNEPIGGGERGSFEVEIVYEETMDDEQKQKEIEVIYSAFSYLFFVTLSNSNPQNKRIYSILIITEIFKPPQIA